MSEWQPLETAPTDGRDILLWHLVRQCQYIGHYSSSWGWYISVRDDSVHFDQCLCWMPLPTKPENADKKLRELEHKWQEMDRRALQEDAERAAKALNEFDDKIRAKLTQPDSTNQ